MSFRIRPVGFREGAGEKSFRTCPVVIQSSKGFLFAPSLIEMIFNLASQC